MSQALIGSCPCICKQYGELIERDDGQNSQDLDV